MQVFLPFENFKQSVQCLDKKRLGNQIWRECKTLINGGWPNHPVAKMWADYKPALALYMWEGLYVLSDRSEIKSETYLNLQEYIWPYLPHSSIISIDREAVVMPPFIGNEEFHLSHRLNLLWKDPTWYSQYFDESVPTSKPEYHWPSPQKIGSETGSRQ